MDRTTLLVTFLAVAAWFFFLGWIAGWFMGRHERVLKRPEAWGISQAELRQPEEQAKNECARAAADAMSSVYVDAATGAVTWGDLKS